MDVCGFKPTAQCESNRFSMTYEPLKRRRPLLFNSILSKFITRCVLITQLWRQTSGGPPFPSNLHDINPKQPRRERHTTFCSCSFGWFCQRNPQAFTKWLHAFHVSQSLRVRQVSKQIRQEQKNKKSTAESCFSSQSAPFSPKKIVHPTQEQCVPPWVV